MQRLGRYEILGELGRGAMGVVFRAHDPVIGRTVAIKTIRLNDLSDHDEQERLRERLFREARSAGILSHPNIVTIYDIGQEGTTAYIAMEFVNGSTLDQVLRSKGAFDPQRLVKLMGETASALDYAHSKGIIHRDVKPANIMLNEAGTVKVTDFGVAKILSQQMTQTEMVLGTPSYMSPEQIEAKQLDGRSDQFALAVIAYELLTGEKPFVAESLPALLFQIVRHDPASVHMLNPTLNEGVGQALQMALEKPVASRYPTCSAFAAALAEALNASPGWRPQGRGAAATQATQVMTRQQPSEASMAETLVSPAPPSPPRPNEPTRVDVLRPTLPDITNTGAPPPAVPLPPMSLETIPIPPRPREEASSGVPAPPPPVKFDTTVRPTPPPPAEPPAPRPVAPPPDPGQSTVFRRSSTQPVEPVTPAAPGKGKLIGIGAAAAVVLLGAVLVVPKMMDSGGEPTPPPVEQAASGTSGPAPVAEVKPQQNPVEASKPPAPTGAAGEVPPAGTPKWSAGSAMIDFGSTPPGAKATVDDGKETCVTPCSLELPAGRHVVRFALEKHRPAIVIINTPREDEANAKMEPLSGKLAIRSDPSDAQIFIDGKQHDKPTPCIVTLPAGKHHIVVKKAGLPDMVQDVDVEDSATRTVDVTWK